MEVHLEENEKKGRVYVGEANASLAEMTFSKAGESLWIIDHTAVSEQLKGQGVGRQMLQKVVEIARERSLKIMPLCPYAKSVFEKDDSIKDVLRT